MIEQESKEIPVGHFPKIPKLLVDSLIQSASREVKDIEIERDQIVSEIREHEPVLLDAIESVGNAYEDLKSVTAGAIAVYRIFKEYEETSFTFPRVTVDLALAFTNEYLSVDEQPEQINAFYSLESTGIELTNPLLSPYHYAEENPHLMVLLAGLPHNMQLGGMLVYELKRRQYHADQLSAQLGDN